MKKSLQKILVGALGFAKKYYIPLLLTVLLSLSAATFGVIAKYVYNDEKSGSFSSPKFYFMSDLLVEGEKMYYLPADTTQININVYNFIDTLQYSEVEISYTVKFVCNKCHECEDCRSCTYCGATVTPSSSSLQKNAPSTGEIVITGVSSGNTYNVSVSASGGFKKELKATFVIAEETEQAFKNVTVYDEYVILTVWTQNASGDFDAQFPVGLIPDNTNPLLKDVKTPISDPGTFEFSLEENSSQSFRFFKGAEYDSSKPFSVTLDSKEVADGTLG